LVGKSSTKQASQDKRKAEHGPKKRQGQQGGPQAAAAGAKKPRRQAQRKQVFASGGMYTLA
jgi:hypothetical protein